MKKGLGSLVDHWMQKTIVDIFSY